MKKIYPVNQKATVFRPWMNGFDDKIKNAQRFSAGINGVYSLYLSLLKKYGKSKKQWGLWCKRPKTTREKEEVIMGAILTQQTNWKNVEKALENLKNKKIVSLRSLYRLGPEKLVPLIKPAGFYKIKAQYLFNLAKFVIVNYGSLKKLKKIAFKKLRKKLLEVKGLGPETTDSILLYALDKPIFVIDEYTRRFVKRFVKKQYFPKKFSYDELQQLFQNNLPKNFRLYQDFHALIVCDSKV